MSTSSKYTFYSFFSKLNQLTYFNLSGNSFASLPTISGCPLLKTLLLHSNQLSGLPNVLVFPHLQYLDLSCNQFETLPNVSCKSSYYDATPSELHLEAEDAWECTRCNLRQSKNCLPLLQPFFLKKAFSIVKTAQILFSYHLQLASFPRLQQLDLSGNTSLSIDMATAKELKYVHKIYR